MAEHRQTKNPLAAFVVRPKRIKFETQEAEEYVLLLLRRHFITNVPWIMVTVVMVVAPTIAARLFPILTLAPVNFQIVAALMWYLLTIGLVMENFLSWYFNVYLVTDERIVDIDFYSLIYKEVSDTKLERIQDVTVVQGGVIRALFNFGTVNIQTAGERREFDFEDVPRPQLVAKFLNEMMLEEEREKIEGRVR
ncbi:MAG: PH domain-containing protein [Candidatus Chisholmbacteria bacterium]|nr:PH domain-containing protein [Candidatus Chisholmbacteria bacterium]